MEILLNDVTIKGLHEKIAAFITLFNRYPVVHVSGTFYDKNGEIAFLTRGMYKVDTSLLGYKYLSILVEKEYMKLCLCDEAIADVKLS